MLGIIRCALDCSVKSFPTVDRVSVRPAGEQQHQGSCTLAQATNVIRETIHD